MKLPSASHLKDTALFALPLIAGQVGQMLFGIGDIAVAGRYSPELLAGLGTATGIFAPFLMLGLGITAAVGPLHAKRRGEKSEEPSFLASSLLTGLLCGSVIMGLIYLLIPFLSFLNLTPEIIPLVRSYLIIVAPSIIPVLLYQTLKEYLQAEDKTFMANAIILVFTLINLPLNALLMFGHGPIPSLGIHGAALATLICRTLMTVVIWAHTMRTHTIGFKIKWDLIKEVLRLGVPIGMGTLTEVLVFSTVTVLVGGMSVLASAGHNIVLNLASLTFMVPLALGSAASVKVGYQYGARNAKELDAYALSALVLAAGFMLFTAFLYFTVPDLLLRFATDDPELLAAGVKLLFFVALFQMPDGLQVTLWGILRGIGVTKVPMFLSLIGNWCIGLPIGCYLAYQKAMEAEGLWAGLAIGLTFMAISLAFVYLGKRRQLQFAFEGAA